MEDIRIGRKTSWRRSVIEVTLSNDSTFEQLLSPNPYRVRAIFTGANNTSLIFVGGPSNSNTLGRIVAAPPFLELDIRTHGIMIYEAFNVLLTGVGSFVIADEFILMEQ